MHFPRRAIAAAQRQQHLCHRRRLQTATSTTTATASSTPIETPTASTSPSPGETNIPASILSRVGRRLHHVPRHPLHTLQHRIALSPAMRNTHMTLLDDRPLSPVVRTEQNFDWLQIPADHISRSPHDTYYWSRDTLLRTHTSAHQVDLLREHHQKHANQEQQSRDGLGFLLAADVYRRDEIDRCHYPIFHQMEGVRVLPLPSLLPTIPREIQSLTPSNGGSASPELFLLDVADLQALDQWCASGSTNPLQTAHARHPEAVAWMAKHLQCHLESMIQTLFQGVVSADGKPLQTRWVDAYFPFTSPSWELEVLYNGAWMEVLGCGIMQDAILQRAGLQNHIGWAFGLGLERIAMALFDIPDIRLFWSQDPRFMEQFRLHEISRFRPFSKYPMTYKDVSFWLPPASSSNCLNNNTTNAGKTLQHDNDFYELVRNVAGDLVEHVELLDEFVHPKTKRQSKCYRIQYRALDRTLSGPEVEVYQQEIRQRIVDQFQGTLR